MALDQQQTFRQLVDERNALLERVSMLKKEIAAARLAGRLEQAGEDLLATFCDCGPQCGGGKVIQKVRDGLRREAGKGE